MNVISHTERLATREAANAWHQPRADNFGDERAIICASVACLCQTASACLQLPEHLDVPALERVPFIEPENAMDVFSCRIKHSINHPSVFSSCQKFGDQQAAATPPSERRQDIKIIDLDVAFSLRYHRHPLAAVNRTRNEADNLIICFRNQKVSAHARPHLFLTLRHEAIHTVFFEPSSLQSGDGLNIRFHCLANEDLTHIKIITGTSTCT